VKQVAQAALKENFTVSQVCLILSESPKFKEISSKQGADNQFARVAIAAAQRQNAINSQPKQQEQQDRKQSSLDRINNHQNFNKFW